MLNCILPNRIYTCWRFHTYKVSLLSRRRALYPILGLHTSRQDYSRHPKDYYSILGVTRHSTSKEIKAAYIEAVKKHHPDTSASTTSTHQTSRQFHDITEAFEILSDRAKKQKYDHPAHDPFFRHQRHGFAPNMRSWDRTARTHNRAKASQRVRHREDVYRSKTTDDTPYTKQELMTFIYCVFTGVFALYVLILTF